MTIDYASLYSVAKLLQYLEGSNAEGRWMSATRLGVLREKAAVEALIQRLNDEHPHVRICAADALGRIGDSRAVDPLIHLLNDDISRVRVAAASGLLKFQDEQAIYALEERRARLTKFRGLLSNERFDELMGKPTPMRIAIWPSHVNVGSQGNEKLAWALQNSEDRDARLEALLRMRAILDFEYLEIFTKPILVASNDQDKEIRTIANELIEKHGIL